MQFKLSTKVKVLFSEKYDNRFEGYLGVVENSSGTCYGVKFEGHYNGKSSTGLYWYDEEDLEFIDGDENVMLSHDENFIVAKVKFLGGSNSDKEYCYALYDMSVKADDLVVVQTGHHGIALAQVSSVGGYAKDRVKCSREIISKVDMTDFNARQEKRKALAQLKADMDKKVKELQETALYELLAEKDPDLSAMLAKYKALIS